MAVLKVYEAENSCNRVTEDETAPVSVANDAVGGDKEKDEEEDAGNPSTNNESSSELSF